MRLRVTQLIPILVDEMDNLTFESTSEGQAPQWSHVLQSSGQIVSMSNEYRDYLEQFSEWGQPRNKREFLRESWVDA